MPKILFIDTWDKGYRNFTRLNSEFEKQGFTTLFIHLGSFLEKINYNEKKIDGITTRDISFYNTIFIKKVIEVERPDVILILNLSFIFDRAIINIAQTKNIKVVYLAHGKLTDPETAKVSENKLNREIWNKLSRIFRKKNLYILLNYIDSQKGKNKFVSFIKIIVNVFKSPANYLTFPKFHKELDADLILLYTKADKELYEKKFLFPEEKIEVVGNPEISNFYNKPFINRESFLSKLSISSKIKYILYLDDGLATNNRWSISQWYRHIIEINNLVTQQNFKLIIKLHPRIKKENHTEFFSNNDIIAFDEVDFKNIIVHSTAVVSHYSSTIIYALLFHKAVLSPRWGYSKDLFKNYPSNIVKYCETQDEFIEGLHSYSPNSSDIDKYLNRNGINLEVNSIKKIVDEIAKQTQA